MPSSNLQLETAKITETGKMHVPEALLRTLGMEKGETLLFFIRHDKGGRPYAVVTSLAHATKEFEEKLDTQLITPE